MTIFTQSLKIHENTLKLQTKSANAVGLDIFEQAQNTLQMRFNLYLFNFNAWCGFDDGVRSDGMKGCVGNVVSEGVCDGEDERLCG